MSTSMRVEDRLEGSGNFRSWKHRLQMIIDENDLLDHVTVGIPEPKDEEQKSRYIKNEKKAMLHWFLGRRNGGGRGTRPQDS
jgi:hypothetical protein